MYTVTVVDMYAAGQRIDNPYVRDTKRQVFIHLQQPVAHSVFRGEDFNTKKWRVSDDRFDWRVGEHDTDVRDAETGFTDLNALFNDNPNPPLLIAHEEVSAQAGLQS